MLLVLSLTLLGCSSGPRHFSTAPVLWSDEDRRPFQPRPEETYVPIYWDGADHIFFRPISHAFLLQTGREAVDVNAMDEVPDSSWFVNRLSRQRMSAEEIARGACDHPPPEGALPWKVVGAKMDGDNPGFRIRTATGRIYVVKFDSTEQWERASAADVVGSRLYHAAGFQVPCNRVVYFRPEDLELPEKPIQGPGGKPVTRESITAMLEHLPREANGTLRALASEFLPGKPLGPWLYESRWGDDPNDAVAHEDRRELRGSRLLAAWLQHHDARSQNTLMMWSEDGRAGGHVEHYIIDWGDCLGGLTQWDSISRRVGHAYYIDFGYMAADFFTFGAIERPWERAEFGPAGKIFGYYSDREFDPEGWHVGYPNVAFSSMQEPDGAWIARIIGRFDDTSIAAVVREARLSSPVARSELERILRSRRDAIVQRYLGRLSSLSDPTVDGRQLCFRDRAAETVLGSAPAPSARVWFSANTAATLPVQRRPGGALCTELPALGAAQQIVELSSGRPGQGPLLVHVQVDPEPRVLGVQRPEMAGSPL
ncbi:MAG TPA: hypothetical protein VGF41_14130 [Myxococcaceae bacterium]